MGQMLSKNKETYSRMNECILCKTYFTTTMKETLCPMCKKTVICNSPLSKSVFLLSENNSDSDSENN